MTDEPPPRRPLPGGIAYVYAQLADDLQERIGSGEFPVGARLPGRGKIAAEYGVAELTVRRALRELADRGIVSVAHTRGAMVTGRSTGTPHEYLQIPENNIDK